MTYPTIPQFFQETVARHGSKTALLYKDGGAWHPISYRDFARHVDNLAAQLVAFGIGMGDRVAILSENRPEWVIADQASLSIGAVNVPIYPTLTADQVRYVLEDSGARAVLVSNQTQLDKVLSIREALPGLEHVIVFDSETRLPKGQKITLFKDALVGGEGVLDATAAERSRRLEVLRGDDLASIIYTSGTTGEPKGATLSHSNFSSNAMAACEVMGLGSEELELAFLPLCHVFERIVYYVMIKLGGTIAYAESFDTIAQNLQEVRPTFIAAVPRVLEKVYARTIDNVKQEPAIKQEIFWAALEVGEYFHQVAAEDGRVPFPTSTLYQLADRLVFSKFRDRLGGRLKLIMTGAAPLPVHVGKFFQSAGIPVIEGYGLTETSPVISVNPPDRPKFGTVGKPIPGVEVRIADDGELLARGPNIMRGYWNKDQATREAIDGEGWFHTGDIARMDSEGYLSIIDRKKELIVMSNGKKVAPQPIENRLKGHPAIDQAMLVGEQRNYISALLVPSYEHLERLAREKGLDYASREELLQLPEIQQEFEQAIATENESLAQFEQIKRFKVVGSEWTAESGELTLSLKLKRRVILERYRNEIEALYDGRPDKVLAPA